MEHRQVLNHINDAERVFTFRAFWFSRGFDSGLPSFEQNTAVSTAHAEQISWASHIEDFRRVRLTSISLFRNMPLEAWLRCGTASDNHFTVRALAFIVVGHFTHHVWLLRERYLQGSVLSSTVGERAARLMAPLFFAQASRSADAAAQGGLRE